MSGTDRTVKCAYCGRANVPVTKKNLMKPHVKPDGRRCMHVLIPTEPYDPTGSRAAKIKRQLKKLARRAT